MNTNKQISQKVPNPKYSDAKFKDKIKSSYRYLETKMLYWVLVAYYGLNSSETPFAAKVQIVAALAYFVMPLDIIPDVMPVVGYGDDLTALMTALTQVAKSISPNVCHQAKVHTKKLRPELKDSQFLKFNKEIGV